MSTFNPRSDGPQRRLRVLVVDDEAAVLHPTAALLDDEFEVASALTGEEALVRLKQQPFDILCTDFLMPRMNGLELFHHALALQPDLSCVLVTGHRDFLTMPKSQRENNYVLLLKPYPPKDLFDSVRRAGQLSRLKQAQKSLSVANMRPQK